MKKIFLLLAAPFVFFTAQADTVTQAEADGIVLELMSGETQQHAIYAKDGVQQKWTITSIDGEVLEVNYKFWIYYVSYIDNAGKYILVKESNGNLLEINVKGDAKPDDLDEWRILKGINPLTYDPGVVINGVKWATRNVDAPGTFAATPESPGMHYQWNCKKAWPVTGAVTDWPTTPTLELDTAMTWKKSNDPSPSGWRVPTWPELTKLCDGKVSRAWVTQNGVDGMKFTDKTTGASLFLPAVGFRTFGSMPFPGDIEGNYWGSMRGGLGVNILWFLKIITNQPDQQDHSIASIDSAHYLYGLCIRAVAE